MNTRTYVPKRQVAIKAIPINMNTIDEIIGRTGMHALTYFNRNAPESQSPIVLMIWDYFTREKTRFVQGDYLVLQNGYYYGMSNSKMNADYRVT